MKLSLFFTFLNLMPRLWILSAHFPFSGSGLKDLETRKGYVLIFPIFLISPKADAHISGADSAGKKGIMYPFPIPYLYPLHNRFRLFTRVLLRFETGPTRSNSNRLYIMGFAFFLPNRHPPRMSWSGFPSPPLQ